jgi:Protein of unknown function (DUF4058)
MTIHDWTRVSAGTFHDFHTRWLTHLTEALNEGVLPEGYYAQAEQRAGVTLPDVLTLHAGESPGEWTTGNANGLAALAIAESPPEVEITMEMDDEQVYRLKEKALVIRHSSGHRVVALVEIVSPSNKDRQKHVSDFVDKVWSAVQQEIHFVLIDLLPPGRHDPVGMHGRVWYDIGGSPYQPPEGKPLTLASYNAREMFPKAYVQPLAVGDELIPMPLFLDRDWYLPLRETYDMAYRGVARNWKKTLEA